MKYDKEYIEQLLQRFMDGETSEREEQFLTEFFSSNNSLPAEWEPYREMFVSFSTDAYSFSKEEMDYFAKEESTTKTRIIKLFPWIAAACMAGAVITTILLPKQSPDMPIVAAASDKTEKEQTECKPQIAPIQEVPAATVQTAKTEKTIKTDNTHIVTPSPVIIKQDAPDSIPHNTILLDENLHYASYDAEDTVAYQAPSRMEEFIMKMANYNHVKGESLSCGSNQEDSLVLNIAYLFDDTKELNLFSRLLQAACWYDDSTPGYLLNYSHQQFFFCLKDMRLGIKYLWIAERVRGKILLYCSHSPLDTEVSSECFREYRDKISNTTIYQNSKEL